MADTFSKAGQWLLPIAVGLASAASPAMARGAHGFSSALGVSQAMAERQKKKEALTRLGEGLKDKLPGFPMAEFAEAGPEALAMIPSFASLFKPPKGEFITQNENLLYAQPSVGGGAPQVTNIPIPGKFDYWQRQQDYKQQQAKDMARFNAELEAGTTVPVIIVGPDGKPKVADFQTSKAAKVIKFDDLSFKQAQLDMAQKRLEQTLDKADEQDLFTLESPKSTDAMKTAAMNRLNATGKFDVKPNTSMFFGPKFIVTFKNQQQQQQTTPATMMPGMGNALPPSRR